MRPLLIIIFVIYGIGSYAQSIQFPIVANSFKSAQGSSAKLRWSVGELVVKKLTGSQYSLYQGASSIAASDVIVLAVDNILDNNSIRIYPNPVQSTLTIENATDCKVRIVDMSGNEVFDKKTLGSTINIGYLNAGIYIIQLQNENGNITTYKIIKI